MSIFWIFKAPGSSSPVNFAAWFQVQQLPKWNTLQQSFSDCQSKVLWPSLSKLFSHINNFLKFIPLFMTKFTSSATSHISVSMNKLNSTQHNILIPSVHSQSASFSIFHVLLTLYEYLCHSQTSAFFTTSGPYVSESPVEVSHTLLPVSEKI